MKSQLCEKNDFCISPARLYLFPILICTKICISHHFTMEDTLCIHQRNDLPSSTGFTEGPDFEKSIHHDLVVTGSFYRMQRCVCCIRN